MIKKKKRTLIFEKIEKKNYYQFEKMKVREVDVDSNGKHYCSDPCCNEVVSMMW